MTPKPCPRCLLRDINEEEQRYKTVREMLEAMPEDSRADEALYAQRLALCKQCDRLISGTCVLCGCYVELRAAQKIRRCPHVPAKW